MSKPRNKWWPYIKAVIRDYPRLKRDYEDLHEQSVTAKYSGTPTGGGASRGTENVAVKELPYTQQKEYDAVRKAVAETKILVTGKERIKLIDLVFWKRSHTLSGAAYKLNLSETTAQRYHSDFIYLVAEKYGLIGGMKHDSL